MRFYFTITFQIHVTINHLINMIIINNIYLIYMYVNTLNLYLYYFGKFNLPRLALAIMQVEYVFVFFCAMLIRLLYVMLLLCSRLHF